MHVAAGTAFARSRGRPPADGAEVGGTRQRIHPWALAFVFGFPAIGGMLTVVAVLSRSGTSDDGAFPLAVGFVGLAGILLVLGLWSRLDVRDDDLMVRFFGFRSTTVRFAEAPVSDLWYVVPEHQLRDHAH